MDKAVVGAAYADFKIIRSRKVCQVVLEIPLEQAQAFIHAFGLPNPAQEAWVAIARLVKGGIPEKPEGPSAASAGPIKPYRAFEDLPLPQQAAMRCQDLSFRDFIRGHFKKHNLQDAKDAAIFVREWCGVESRSHIRPDTPAGDKWGQLNNRYLLWLSAQDDAA
jgi:hypothetical protein